MKLNICEMFFSIQGESTWSGFSSFFIRCSGCNLDCSYCDTKYAKVIKKEIKISEIISKLEKFKFHHITLTGGEPLLQENIYFLIEKLGEKNYKVLVETNGSLSIEKLSTYPFVKIVMDIKCPNSRMQKFNLWENLVFLREKDEIKFVILDKVDYEWAKNIINSKNINCIINFSPVWETDFKKLSEWILKDQLSVRLNLQIHKFIWKNEKEGVRL